MSPYTIISWRAKFGGMEPVEAMRLRHLEAENGQLKKLVAEICLEREMLRALPKRYGLSA